MRNSRINEILGPSPRLHTDRLTPCPALDATTPTRQAFELGMPPCQNKSHSFTDSNLLDAVAKKPQPPCMQNRWSDAGLKEALSLWQKDHGSDLAHRLYSARLIGSEPNLVLHGGGNVSIKCTIRDIFGDAVEAVCVKASGSDMSCLTPQAIPPLRLGPLRRLRTLSHLDDDAMVKQVRGQLLDSTAPTPSIEALLHAFLPHKFVDHSHADSVLALTNQSGGDGLVREALGDRVAYLPYIRPGFELAKAVAQAVDDAPGIEGVVLMFHGLITFGVDARTSYDRHISLCTACEELIEKKSRGRKLSVRRAGSTNSAELAAGIAPVIRGALAEVTAGESGAAVPQILEWRSSAPVLNFVNSDEAAALCNQGALTGDHVMHTRPWPLFIASLDWNDDQKLQQQVRDAVAGFRVRYAEYIAKHGAKADALPTAPRVVLIPQVGLFASGATKAAARISADLAEHTIATKVSAHFAGSYAALADDHMFDMEFRTIQRAKLGRQFSQPLANRVVVISGAAGAIGIAVAQCCAEAGAHVVLSDIDATRLNVATERVNEKVNSGRAIAVPMDVTDERSVREGFEEIARSYGGFDVLVPNAGVAHVAAIVNLELSDFRRVMDVNGFGAFLFMREGIRQLQRQAIGGQIVIIASKNVFAPGKDFAAYSASKAAAHQLGKVAAIELAPHRICVNMVNPDGIFGDSDSNVRSGLWDSIGENRARSRNIPVGELPDFYRQRNLLKTRVDARHVGHAVVFFASGQTPTTGATLPVDGGIIEAFPR